MLRLSELKKTLELKQELGISLNEGSCFGVTNHRELRPPFNLRPKETAEAKGKKKER